MVRAKKQISQPKPVDCIELEDGSKAPLPQVGEYSSALSGDNHNALVKSLAEYGCKEAEIELICSLSLTEREVFSAILQELVTHGKSRTLLQLWEHDYLPNRRPVRIDDFLSDPYYAGSICEGFLRDCWRKELSLVLDQENPKFEWVLRGAIGTGKTSAIVLALIYKLYLLSCLRSPQEYYNLMRGRFIVFGIFSATLKQARTAAFKQFRSYVDAIPYFREHFPRDRRADYILRFPRDILVTDGSDIMHALGQDVYGGLADEINFFRGKGGDPVRATELYDGITRRVMTRFYDKRLPFPGLFCIASSERHENDWLDKHCKELDRGGEGSQTQYHISRLSLWEATPERFSTETFRVVVGNKFVQSRIIDDEQETPKDLQVISVPKDFYQSFVRDIDGSLRDIAGVPTWSETPFIRNTELVYECSKNPLSYPGHPFTIDIAQGRDSLLESFKFDDLFVPARLREGYIGMRRFSGSPRFIHCDLSKNKDATGIAMVVPVIQHRDVMDEPTFILEFAIRMVADVGQEINYRGIRDFIRTLKRYGCPIRLVTFDQYQSVDSKQLLQDWGIETKELSVEKPQPYNALKRAILDGRMALYDYHPLLDELTTLQFDSTTNKVDHIAGKSKDVADAVAGAVYSAIVNAGPLVPLSPPDLDRFLGQNKDDREAVIAGFNKSITTPTMREDVGPIQVKQESVRERLLSTFPKYSGRIFQQLKQVPFTDNMLAKGLEHYNGDIEELGKKIVDDPDGLWAIIHCNGN